jgi:hypothetical protein
LKICLLPCLPSDGCLLTRTPSSFKRVGSNPPNGVIDIDVFEQVLELDDDDGLFSKDMVDAYFVQADKTFNDMDAALWAFITTLPASAPDVLIGF